MTNCEAAYSEIEKLTQKFKATTARQRKNMNEHATRQGYILPMFRALGWDIDNINEVSPEEKVSRGFVDFSFRIGGVPRYFLETKRADEDLNNPLWVRQTIDYAWTKSVTWALLSDFEGTRVFNAEWKEDNPFRALFFEFNLETYLSDFERLWWLSREQTALGKLDKEGQKVGRSSKRLPVSQELFGDLKKWRELLYNDFKLYNPILPPGDIDNAILHLLNRLIFIRTAEDRHVESIRLRAFVRELKDRKQFKNWGAELSKLFRELDGVYNSELFAPHFSDGLEFSPSILEQVIDGLYEKHYIHYNFNALEADVLGTVYEQYLGAVVADKSEEVVKPKKGAKQPELISEGMSVQERRTKRKSQGIYYTPSFVTKYIVQQTVGKYLEENGYNPSKAPKILDMACGSGSFLIEAFDVMDRFVMDMRHQNSEFSENSEFLARARQLEVLENCIYGVDKDKQAVEVARLNLLLRALHSREKLPMLNNIQRGNSLISGTTKDLKDVFGDDGKSKDPFDWEENFFDVMKNGGFDIIIGNPPYVRANNMDKQEREYWQTSGQFSTITGKFDIYILFLEKAINLLKSGGRLGFIIPYPFLSQNYAELARKMILQKCAIESIYDLSEYKVFEDAAVATCVLVLRKTQDIKKNMITVLRPNEELIPAEWKIKQSVFSNTPQNMFRLNADTRASSISEKIWKLSKPLSDFSYVGIGIDVHDSKAGTDKSERIHKKPKGQHYKPYVEGKEIGRYKPPSWTRYLEYLPEKMHRPKYPEMFETEKILVQVVVGREGIIATIDREKLYAEQSLSVCIPKYILAPTGKKDTEATPEQIEISKHHSLSFILGLLCSKLMNWYFNLWLSDNLHVVPENLRQLPFYHINFNIPAEKAAHDEIVTLVEKMLELQNELRSLEPGRDISEIPEVERKIARIDEEIDQRVYQLYGLTEEEIKVVEGK